MHCKKLTYRTTMRSCFVGYIVQAIVNNYVPLLFVTLQNEYSIPLSQITLLVTFNFGIQMVVDTSSAVFVDKMGYRVSAVLAHIFAASGLIMLTFLPSALPSPFIGILISVAFYAIGGGLLEVLVSPIMESCPTDNKEKAMSMLHSFYCWGHVGVVIISTLFFKLFSIDNWRILAVLWAVIPLVNMLVFAKAPIAPILPEGNKGLSIRDLAGNKIFWILFVMMLCAGASEQAVSQWTSAFAEKGLGVSKTVGDLAGPLSFAAMMGCSRLLYGKAGQKINLDKFMIISCLMCVSSYICLTVCPSPVVGLMSCGVCGFSVGIMWPGTFSKATGALPGGGTAMFALLALAGDIGCAAGPTVVGGIAGKFGDKLQYGFAAAILFPVLLLIGIATLKKCYISAKSRKISG